MPIRASVELSDIRRHDGIQIPLESKTVNAVRYEPVDVDEPAPALLMYTPYRNEDFSFARYDGTLHYLAKHGYEVVAADLLGTGASTGRKSEPYTPDEGPQAAAIIKWLAEIDWTNGRIGMFGLSYGGLTSLKAAAEQPEPLEAIVPIHAPYTGYRDRYPGGTFWLYGRNRWGSMQQALLPTPPARRDPSGQWLEAWKDHLEELRDSKPFLFQFLDYDSLPEYWAGKDIPVENIQTPTFAVSGWRDYFPGTTLEYMEQIQAPSRLLLGPWRHTMPHKGRESAIDFRRQMVEWFDHFLKDVENDALEHDRIEFWTERNGGGKVDEGTWRGTDSWATVGETSEELVFCLSENGLVTPGAVESELERTYEPDHTVGVESTALDIAPPVDTNADDARSMVFETPPLDRAIETTGTGQATLRFVPTTADPIIAVRVIDVAPDGMGTLITHGELAHGDFRVNMLDNRSSPEELVPGEEYTLTLPLKPKSHVFEEGHRIRVAISGAFFPLMLPPREQGEFTARSTPDQPSTITLPGREHDNKVVFDNEIEMESSDETVPMESKWLIDESSTWDVTRHNMSDSVTVTVTGRTESELPNAGASIRYFREIKTNVKGDDPSTAAADCRQEITIEYETKTVRVIAETRTTRDTGYATTRLTENERTVFEETWAR